MPVIAAGIESGDMVRLEGDLGIDSAEELKSVLSVALASGNALHLDLSNVSSLDVTAIQLLGAAAEEAKRNGTVISYDGVPGDLACVVRQAGFETFLSRWFRGTTLEGSESVPQSVKENG